jgi:hypothetical protein
LALFWATAFEQPFRTFVIGGRGASRIKASHLPELIKHKDQLHPFMRRYLIERMREAQNKYQRLADAYGSDIQGKSQQAKSAIKS